MDEPRPAAAPRLRMAALLAFVAVALSPTRPAWSQAALRLLVVDVDAHRISATSRGALFSIDPLAPTTASPGVELAADLGEPAFEFLADVVVSPLDFEAYVLDGGRNAPPFIDAVACGTRMSRRVSTSAGLAAPYHLEFLADGRLVVVDREADPSGLGPDSLGGLGHGAVSFVDLATGALTLISDGTNHAPMPGVSAGRSCFEDPAGAAYDPTSGVLYVVDPRADPLGLARDGAVYSVDVATGFVDLVSSSTRFVAPISIAVRPSGAPLVVDTGGRVGASAIWRIDLTNSDPSTNALLFTGGMQYAVLEDADADAADTVYVVDSGDYDVASMTFRRRPAILRVDESLPSPVANAVLVNRSLDLFTPVAISARPECARPAAGLAINRQVTGTLLTSLVAPQFSPGCQVTGWVLCPDTVVNQPLAGLTLMGEAASTGVPSVWFYEHSDPVTTMKVARNGSDLVFASN